MEEELDEAAAITLTNEARVLINQNKPSELMNEQELKRASQLIEKALKLDGSYYVAYLEKGRALRRLWQLKNDRQLLEDALKAAYEARRHGPENYYPSFYNAACYKALLGAPLAEVVAELKRAIELKPALKTQVPTDDDLISVRNTPEIQGLLSG